MAKAYWISTYRSISNPDALAAYAKLAGPALTGAGGRFLARGMPAQVYEAGIQQRTVLLEFDSVEAARAFKPSPLVYRMVAEGLGVAPSDCCMVASHVWDTIGAQSAGWQAALILREGNAPLDVGPQPDWIGKDLDAVADQLIERYATGG